MTISGAILGGRIVEEALVEHKVIGLGYGAHQAIVLAQKGQQLLGWPIHGTLRWCPLLLTQHGFEQTLA